ncbi:GEVED domain-containing protein [Polaribacter cellanae]|uniref:S8 family serine peptidase n=1 Tax=Polaribacter cellanae TaxID=2818493 RepID=A0A975CLY5_9FLAO|nr:GEVED domain-containing protein [Polaribacter cellanae]QTE21517.1 S8 family serine peptidase [Polaribacter cellanae]
MKKSYLSKLLAIGVFFAFTFALQAQKKSDIEKIRKKYNLSKLKQIKKTFQEEILTEKQKAIRIAEQKGWEVFTQKPDGEPGFMELQKVVDGHPIYFATYNVDAARSTRTNHLNTGGSLGLNLLGQNMTAYVWDGGAVQLTHQDFDGAGGNNRVSILDNEAKRNSNTFHAQHVTGTIVGSGEFQANSKGMAPHANAITADWNNDVAEATDAAANGMLISNHSYGPRGDLIPDYYFGAYIVDSRRWDALMFNAPNYLMVVAAGNDGDQDAYNASPLEGNSSYDKLTGHSTSKNNLVVANAQDANVDADGNLIQVLINSSSSEGPTDDLRIKPDITGNGTNVYSAFDFESFKQNRGAPDFSDGNTDDDYYSISGTSMASPNVAGTLLLLQQHNNNTHGSFMKAATLKGLALHTADDAGANGPDAIFGWGLLNAKKAAEAITQKGNQSKIEELTLAQGQTYTITVDSDGVNPLLASISWTDRPGTATTATNSPLAVLVNDLDIRVSKNGTTSTPWRLTGVTTNGRGDNNKDPYERVDIANASGTYTITVTHKGNLTGGSQNYSLIVTGLSGVPVVCNATTPSNLTVDEFDSSTATVSWNSVAGTSYDFRYRKVGSSSWTTSSVATATTSLSNLSPQTSYEVQVRSKCPNNTTSAYSASVNFTTTEVQLNYCSSNGNSVSDEYISKVVLGSINNTSGASSGGYADYTSQSTNITKGASTTITITPTWPGTNYNEGYAVFIDYNKDGDFADNGETVWTKTASKTTPVSGSFSIPASAITGTTRMRVVMQYNTVPSSCGTFNYGETEDYTVNITNGVSDTQAPTAPTGLSASNITQTTATLSWTASTDNVAVTKYEIFNNNTSVGTVTGTSANITGLTANTSYTYTVKAKDEAENTSTPSNSVTFTTLGVALNYCSSKGNRATYEWIDNIELGGMKNATSANAGYGDFTSKIATLAQGSSNTMVVSAGFSSTAYTEHWAVWIDFNQNGTFDSNEKVVSGSSSSSNNLTATVAVPSNALLGQTRMRVSMKYNSAQTACETFSDGEVEDYTVNITQNTPNNYTIYTDSTKGEVLGSEISSSLEIFPNPTTNFVQVKFGRSKNLSFKIINTIGQVIKAGKLQKRTIDVSTLKRGIYLLEVNDGQKSVKNKLIKK